MSKVQKPGDRLEVLVDELEHLIGDDLIGVGYHSNDDWQPLFMRMISLTGIRTRKWNKWQRVLFSMGC